MTRTNRAQKETVKRTSVEVIVAIARITCSVHVQVQVRRTSAGTLVCSYASASIRMTWMIVECERKGGECEYGGDVACECECKGDVDD